MKKITALVLSLVLMFGVLAACGGSGDTGSSNAPASAAPASNAPAEGSDSSAPAGGGSYDTVKLVFSTTYNEMETSGQAIKYFTDYVTEHSGGSVTFDIKWGGTLAGTGEELTFLQNGAFDMSVLGQSQYSDVFALLNFPGQTDGSQEKCMDYFKNIVYENPKTAPLIQAQIEAQGVKMIGFMANGGNAFAAKQEMNTLADLTKYKLGVGMNHSAFESMGFVVQAMMPWDGYDSISKGIVDVAYMSMAPMISLNWHEAAPYFVSTNSYAAGNYFTIGLDKWNSLSPDTQALFQEAMDATSAYTVELMAEQEKNVASALEAAGGKLLSLNDADTQVYSAALFKCAVTDCRALAQSGNCAGEMETVLAACSEYLGLPLE